MLKCASSLLITIHTDDFSVYDGDKYTLRSFHPLSTATALSLSLPSLWIARNPLPRGSQQIPIDYIYSLAIRSSTQSENSEQSVEKIVS